MLRIRNKVKVRELNITAEKLKSIEKVYQHPGYEKWFQKGRELLRNLGISPCANCGGIPSVELQYPSGEAVIVEYYCDKCKETVFERTKSEPEDPKEIASFYGCSKVTSLPPTPSSVRYPGYNS